MFPVIMNLYLRNTSGTREFLENSCRSMRTLMAEAYIINTNLRSIFCLIGKTTGAHNTEIRID